MTTHTPAIAPPPQRAAAIEAALQAHGLDAKAGIELGVHNAEDVWLPERGARVVAKAWLVCAVVRPRSAARFLIASLAAWSAYLASTALELASASFSSRSALAFAMSSSAVSTAFAAC